VTNVNLRVGLIGAGGVARTHAQSLSVLDRVEITAVADVSAERAEALAADCGAKAFTDHRDLLDDVDVVYVCSPPTAHREHLTAAAAAGRHVFCEKPFAITLEDGSAITEAVFSGGVHVMWGSTAASERYSNGYVSRSGAESWATWSRRGSRVSIGRQSNRSTSGRAPTSATWRSRDTSSSAFGRTELRT